MHIFVIDNINMHLALKSKSIFPFKGKNKQVLSIPWLLESFGSLQTRQILSFLHCVDIQVYVKNRQNESVSTEMTFNGIFTKLGAWIKCSDRDYHVF